MRDLIHRETMMAYKAPFRSAFQEEVTKDPSHQESRRRETEFGTSVAKRKRGRRAPDDFTAKGFASRLKKVLTDKGITPDEIARRLGYDPTDRSHVRQIQRWTTPTNPTIPDAALLMAICAEFRISANYLLFGTGGEGFNASGPVGELGERLAVALRDELRARHPNYPDLVEVILKRDSDVFRRLVDVYDLRVRLEAAAPVLGLSPRQLQFAHREIEVRLVRRNERAKKPETRKAAERHLRKSRAQHPPRRADKHKS